jgi:hypothetical protein
MDKTRNLATVLGRDVIKSPQGHHTQAPKGLGIGPGRQNEPSLYDQGVLRSDHPRFSYAHPGSDRSGRCSGLETDLGLKRLAFVSSQTLEIRCLVLCARVYRLQPISCIAKPSGVANRLDPKAPAISCTVCETFAQSAAITALHYLCLPSTA